MSLKSILGAILWSVMLTGCEFQETADEQFGDQYFKTSIALIELYKVRTGDYPDALSDLQFLGRWDGMALQSVEYRKLGSGYELNMTKGWVGMSALNYPAEFWQGLGLKRSNVQSAVKP